MVNQSTPSFAECLNVKAERVMMIALKELRAHLYTAVGAAVAEFGFKTEKMVFRRPIEGGSQTLPLAYIRHATDFDVTANIAVRFDDVQDLRLDGNKTIKPSEARHLMSFGAELGNIQGSGQKRWTIRESADIPEVVPQIITTFKEIGLPYLDKFSDRRTALEVVAKDGPTAWLLMPVHDARAKLALALCVVLHDRESFETILAHKLEYLAARNDWGLAEVREFGDRMRDRLNA